MTNQHPITPPPELAQQWVLEAHSKFAPAGTCPDTRILIARAAQWGADQELKACCADIRTVYGRTISDWLRSLRRSKPPSLKEQALKELAWVNEHLDMPLNAIDTIRRALEQLDD